MSWEDRRLIQAKGIYYVFFEGLYILGYKISEELRHEIGGLAYQNHALHTDSNKVEQVSIQEVKLMSFVTYHLLEHNSTADKKKVAELCLRILQCAITDRGLSMPNPTRQYLQSLIHHEVSGQPQVGIGSNGLAAAMNMLCGGDHTV